jgi:hypothetical protein
MGHIHRSRPRCIGGDQVQECFMVRLGIEYFEYE